MDAIVLDHEVTGADERRHVRFDGRVPCYLEIGEDAWRARIRDLSVGGAGLEPAMPATLGQTVRLSCPAFGFETPLTGRVVNVAHRRTCIEFDLNPEAEAELIRFLEQNT
ncbi:MAG: PilZ domain-containing protein [Geminicoccaceae bacterium]|nr:PilZ domain-containing protein [Geminicoccaceae bacterium]